MIEVGYRSDKGLLRDNNEDSCYVSSDGNIFMVADGVGGNNAGEVASSETIKIVSEHIKENDIFSKNNKFEIAKLFNSAIAEANSHIVELGKNDNSYKGMATTLVIAHIRDENLYVANIGDSRAYVYRQGKLTQVTEDHSYVNTLLQMGAITSDEARNHSEGHKITRAVGAESQVEADYFKVRLRDNDVIVLCTDGLYDLVTDQQIAMAIDATGNMVQLADLLIDMANRAGGKDNVTTVCITVRGGNQNE